MAPVLNKIPIWFKAIVIVLLIWNLMGVLNFVMQLYMTEEAIALPENQQIFYSEFTWLSKLAFAMGVFGGTLGCIALLAKKESCHKKLSGFLFIGIIIQMNHNLGLANGGEIQSYILVCLVYS